MTYRYEYERPALTVDCVVFGLNFGGADDGENTLDVLLVERKLPPFEGAWALPGGFAQRDETLEAAARRELSEETNVGDVFLEQLYTFGDPGRDPRGWTVTVAYYALVASKQHQVRGGSDATRAGWFPVRALPRLAFDHAAIIDAAWQRLKGKVRYAPIGFELLPRKFTISQLQKLYETILERPLDNRNFRKKILGMDVLRELDEWQSGVAHRAARLYRFDERKYRQLTKQGFNFEL